MQKSKRHVGCHWSHSWGNKWCEEGKEACLDPRIWVVQDAIRRSNCWSAKEIHTYCQLSYKLGKRV